MDWTDKLKMRGIKSTIKTFLPELQKAITRGIEEKKKIELQENEKDIILICFHKENKAYISLVTVSENKQIMRTLFVSEVNENAIEAMINLI
jgi:hypothetical protein